MARLILGHITDSSIKIWVRGSARWPVAFVDVLDSAGRRTRPTKTLVLDQDEFWTDVVEWDGLAADRPYKAKVWFGKTENTQESERIRDAYTEGRFRTFPSADQDSRFSFLLGSCNLHSLGLIKNPDKAWGRISEVASRHEARFMIHCGDQIYADLPLPAVPDPDFYRKKYLDAWSDCRPARAFLTEVSHYMIMDDHEITNNFDNDMYFGAYDSEALKNAALKAYWEFQHKHNPGTAGPGARKYYYSFACSQTQFFVMDTRYGRRSDSGRMIDEEQMRALLTWLSEHSSSLKFIVTSVPFLGEVKRPKQDKWCDPAFAGQRQAILEHLHANNIDKTVFLTGDMHTSYLAQTTLGQDENAITIYELMSSPINQFTPDEQLEDRYDPKKTFATANGLKVSTTIRKKHFYGDHSNVMAIDVQGSTIKFNIYRTSRSGNAALSSRFSV